MEKSYDTNLNLKNAFCNPVFVNQFLIQFLDANYLKPSM